MTGLCGPILPPCVRVCKPEPSSWGLLGAEVGGDSMLLARNVVFAFIRTHLSYGFRSSAWTGEPFMPALDQAAPGGSRDRPGS